MLNDAEWESPWLSSDNDADFLSAALRLALLSLLRCDHAFLARYTAASTSF